jgi:hypothetical protein
VIKTDGVYNVWACDPTLSIATTIEEVSDEMIRVSKEQYIDINYIAEIGLK